MVYAEQTLLPPLPPVIRILQHRPVDRLGALGHHCLNHTVHHRSLFIKLHLRHHKVLFFVDWLNRCPLTVEEFFGIDGVHGEACSFAVHDTKAVQLYGCRYFGSSTHPELSDEVHLIGGYEASARRALLYGSRHTIGLSHTLI